MPDQELGIVNGVPTLLTTSDNIEDCTTSVDAVAVYDAVFVSLADKVSLAANTNAAQECLGLVFEKVDSTHCRVITQGRIIGWGVGMTPGTRYYLHSVAGDLTTVKPASAVVQQVVAVAFSATDLYVCPSLGLADTRTDTSGVTLDAAYDNSSGDTYTITTDAGPIILTGASSSSALRLVDSNQLTFGTSDDVQLAHDGTDFTIDNTFATGDTILKLGDTAAATSVLVTDSGDVTQFSVDSNGNVVVTGDLTVNGTTITVESETVLLADNYLNLNDGYTAVSAQTGGLVVNYLPTATTTTTNGVYVAGVDGVSDPTVVTTGSGTFSATDLIQISGSDHNDGLYEVQGQVTTTLTIKSTANGVTNQVEDFTQDQFVAGASDGATITQVNLSVIRTGTDGEWEVGKDSTTPLTFVDLATTGFTLNDAYDASTGESYTIATDDGPIILSGSPGMRLNDDVGLEFGTGPSATLTWDTSTYTSPAIDLLYLALGGTNYLNVDGYFGIWGESAGAFAPVVAPSGGPVLTVLHEAGSATADHYGIVSALDNSGGTTRTAGDYNAFEARITGNSGDSSGATYAAFVASDATDSGGSSKVFGLHVGTGYDQSLLIESGGALFKSPSYILLEDDVTFSFGTSNNVTLDWDTTTHSTNELFALRGTSGTATLWMDLLFYQGWVVAGAYAPATLASGTGLHFLNHKAGSVAGDQYGTVSNLDNSGGTARSGGEYSAFEVRIKTHATDSNSAPYTAFRAANATDSGGTSLIEGFHVGTGYDEALRVESGTTTINDDLNLSFGTDGDVTLAWDTAWVGLQVEPAASGSRLQLGSSANPFTNTISFYTGASDYLQISAASAAFYGMDVRVESNDQYLGIGAGADVRLTWNTAFTPDACTFWANSDSAPDMYTNFRVHHGDLSGTSFIPPELSGGVWLYELLGAAYEELNANAALVRGHIDQNLANERVTYNSNFSCFQADIEDNVSDATGTYIGYLANTPTDNSGTNTKVGIKVEAGYDRGIWMPDISTLDFGTGGDVKLYWNSVPATDVMLALPLNQATEWHWGTTTVGFDMTWFASSVADMKFDCTADTLTLDGIDLHLGDDDELVFGDSSDLVFDWNSSFGLLFVVPAASAASIQWGSTTGGNNISHRWQGSSSTTYMNWSAPSDQLKLVDDVELAFGTNAEATITYIGDVSRDLIIQGPTNSNGNQGSVLIRTGTNDTNSEVAFQTAAGADIFRGVGDGDFAFGSTQQIFWDESTSILYVNDSSVLRFLDSCQLQLGTGQDMNMYSNGSGIIVESSNASTDITWGGSLYRFNHTFIGPSGVNDTFEINANTRDVHLDSDWTLTFGDSNEYTFEFDTARLPDAMLVTPSADHTDWVWGAEDGSASIDMEWIGNTNIESWGFSSTLNELWFDGVDIELRENDQLRFGTTDQFRMFYETANTCMRVLPTVDNDDWFWGKGSTSTGISMTWWNTSTSSWEWDPTVPSVIFDGVDIHMKDDDLIAFGDSWGPVDTYIQWWNSATSWNFNNQHVTGRTVFTLGTDTAATEFRISSNNGDILFQATGLGEHTIWYGDNNDTVTINTGKIVGVDNTATGYVYGDPVISATIGRKNVIGAVRDTATTAQSARVATLPGTLCTAPNDLAAMGNGDILFLASSGDVTNKPPTTGVTHQVGWVTSNSTDQYRMKVQNVGIDFLCVRRTSNSTGYSTTYNPFDTDSGGGLSTTGTTNGEITWTGSTGRATAQRSGYYEIAVDLYVHAGATALVTFEIDVNGSYVWRAWPGGIGTTSTCISGRTITYLDTGEYVSVSVYGGGQTITTNAGSTLTLKYMYNGGLNTG